jgi:hypothetical protein
MSRIAARRHPTGCSVNVLCGGVGRDAGIEQGQDLGRGRAGIECPFPPPAEIAGPDVVVVWRLDRWGRSLPDLVVRLRERTELGIGSYPGPRRWT